MFLKKPPSSKRMSKVLLRTLRFKPKKLPLKSVKKLLNLRMPLWTLPKMLRKLWRKKLVKQQIRQLK